MRGRLHIIEGNETPPTYQAAEVLLEIAPRLGRVLEAALKVHQPQLSLRQFRILQRLADGPQRAAELADSTQVSRPTMSVAVSALEEQGWVRRDPDPDDRRAAAVQLTPAGGEAYEEARVWLHEVMTLVAGDLQDGDVQALEKMRGPLIAGMDTARAWIRQVRDAGGSPT